MQTIAETPMFMKQADKLLAPAEREALIDFLAANPEAGDVIEGTGGIRKVRFALPGRGKSGGARVIYYYHSAAIPLYALLIYAKNAKTDLTPGDKKALRALVAELKP